MVTATATPSTTPEIAGARSVRQIVGVVISVVIGAFLAFDVVGKLTQPEAVVEGTAKLGFPIEQAYVMGTVLLVCLAVYAIPRTAALGALGITAYLGGAVTANMRIESPVVSTTLFAVYVGVLMWVGLILRRPELLKVVGLRR
ncbi:DoxX family protein [Streptomyces sp. SID6673]|nr:DoxX family protein [Streptomyces sp. SID11726]NEB24486.1 DoxX family protein [Streptomyces sp. SID6673]